MSAASSVVSTALEALFAASPIPAPETTETTVALELGGRGVINATSPAHEEFRSFPTPIDTQWAAFPKFRARDGLEPVPPRPLPQLATDKAPDRHATAKVLVVDDETPLRLIYRVNLEDEGLEVVEAADGRIGLEKAKTEAPDLILLDVMMPGLGGWQVAEYLRAEPATRAIPFVFVTPLSQYRLYGLVLGAVDYITLPCNPRELASRARALLTSTPKELHVSRRERIAEAEALMERGLDRPQRTVLDHYAMRLYQRLKEEASASSS